MKMCPACGGENEGGARFCLECGESFDEITAEPSDPWLGRMVSGRFRIVRKLGDGGMGEVYLAEQLPMGRDVALKVLRQHLADDPQAVERFKREAQAASQLAHPNTIIVYDFGQDPEDGTLFLAMEYLEGTPLDELIAEQGALPPERVARILAQVCGSLQEAHERRMIHRDLKPENIFLTERTGSRDFVKVLDFGIAKVTHSSKGERLETITRAGAVFGTPQYMSPEQIRGEDLDPRSDVYALGVILYEMISGHLPFDAGTVMELLTQHLSAAPAPIARGPAPSNSALARLEAVAMRALSKDPAQRQPSARAFLEDIMAAMPELALNPGTSFVPTAAPITAEAPASGGGRSMMVVLVAAVLAAGAAAAFFVMNGGPGSTGGGDAPLALAPDQEATPAAGGEEATPAEEKPAEEKPAEEKPAEEKPAEAAAEPAEKPMTAEEKAEADKVEAEAEAEAKAAEEEEKAEEKGDTLSDAEAKAIAEKAAAEEAAAKAEQEKAAAQEKAAKAEAAKKAAEEKAAADAAAKKDAEAKAAAAQMEKAAAQAKTAEAKAAADKAKAEAEKAKAEAEKAKAELAAIRAAQEEAKAAAEAAKAAQEEARLKAEEAKAKKAAAKKKQRHKAQWGKVLIKSRTRGVQVYVDGKLKGKTPLKVLRLKAGKHEVEARKGKKSQKRRVVIKKGKVQRLTFKL